MADIECLARRPASSLQLLHLGMGKLEAAFGPLKRKPAKPSPMSRATFKDGEYLVKEKATMASFR